MTGRWRSRERCSRIARQLIFDFSGRGHTAVTALSGGIKVILTETPQLFESCFKHLGFRSPDVVQLGERSCRLGMYHATICYQLNIQIAAQRGLWRRCRVQSRCSCRNSLLAKKVYQLICRSIAIIKRNIHIGMLSNAAYSSKFSIWALG